MFLVGKLIASGEQLMGLFGASILLVETAQQLLRIATMLAPNLADSLLGQGQRGEALRSIGHMELKALKDFYIHELKDLYIAEEQIIKALPKMAKAASNPQLADGVQAHSEETKERANRLEAILKNLGHTRRGPKCQGMEGVVTEGAEMFEEDADADRRQRAYKRPAQGSNSRDDARVHRLRCSGPGSEVRE